MHDELRDGIQRLLHPRPEGPRPTLHEPVETHVAVTQDVVRAKDLLLHGEADAPVQELLVIPGARARHGGHVVGLGNGLLLADDEEV